MAVDIKPSTWIASYDYASSTLKFPLASLTGLSAGDCDPTTGNIEKILLCLLATLQAKQDSFSTADKPVKMVMSTGNSVTNTTTTVTFTGSAGAFTLGSE